MYASAGLPRRGSGYPLNMKLSILLLRLLIGGLFIGHGTQKLFGWFGGHGLEGTGAFFEALGLKPGKTNAVLAGAGEAGGGALLAAGLATPIAGAAITGAMTSAIRHVHATKGPWVSEGGWEYNAVVIASTLAVVEMGPGPISLDHLLGTERSGTGWALAAAAAGVGGSFAVSAYAKRNGKLAEQPEEFGAVPFQTAEAERQAEAAPTTGESAQA
jgi:putative oxidoreductase